MPTLSASDVAILRQHPVTIDRYLSVCPRTPVFAARTHVTSWSFDGATGGIYQIGYNQVTLGSYLNVQPGMTLDVGTTPGGFDIAKIRIRAAATATVLKIAETAQGALAGPMLSGYYLTVRDERRLWPRLPLLVETQSTGTKYYDTFDYTVDYDVVYTGETLHFPPLANIEARPAGWVDDGQATRTVMLDGSSSAAVAKGATISAYAWSLLDGTLAPGYSLTDAAIVATFPAGFRHVALTVTDSNGTASTRYFPVWAHSDAYPPITDFLVERDETEQGREMDFTIFGDVDSAREAVIPEGTLFCYWEQATFGDRPAPAQYRSQYLGWAVRNTVRFQLDRSQYFVATAGPATWLNLIGNVALSWLRRASPSEWYHMADCTDDRAIATLLRYCSTALEVCNLHLSGVITEWGQPPASDYAALKADKGSIWQQVSALAAEYSGFAGCDSLGAIWLRRHPCLMPDDFSPDRDDVASVLTLVPADWPHEDAPDLPHDFSAPVGQVEVDGFYWIGGVSGPLRARAPGATPGYGAQSETIPAQVLYDGDTALAGTWLNQIAGHWWAWLNNPRKDVPLTLLAALDVVEPAWLEWVTLEVSQENVRGTVLDSTRFLVTRVSVQHSNAPGQPPHRVTWTLAQETAGEPGRTVPIPTSETVPTDYEDPDDWYPGDAGGTLDVLDLPFALPGTPDTIAAFNADGYLYRTANFTAAPPSWTRYDLGLGGPAIYDFVVDAFSPGYLGTGTAINGWFVTYNKIYRIADIFGARTVTVQHTFSAAPADVRRTIQSQWGIQNWVMVLSHHNDGGGTVCTYTTNGTTWTEVQLTPYTYSGEICWPSLWVSSRTPGLARAGAFQSPGGSGTGKLYQTANYGATWTPVSTPATNFNDELGGGLEFPYDDNPTEKLGYWNWRDASPSNHRLYRTAADGVTMADITPAPADELGPRSSKRLASCGSNRQLLAGVFTDPDNGRRSVWVSLNAGTSWGTADLEGVYPTASSDYLLPFLAGDESGLYLVGGGGAIGYSADLATLQDKRGNIASMSPTPGDFVGLCGGPA